MALFKAVVWALIFLTKLRFPPGVSIAIDLCYLCIKVKKRGEIEYRGVGCTAFLYLAASNELNNQNDLINKCGFENIEVKMVVLLCDLLYYETCYGFDILRCYRTKQYFSERDFRLERDFRFAHLRSKFF